MTKRFYWLRIAFLFLCLVKVPVANAAEDSGSASKPAATVGTPGGSGPASLYPGWSAKMRGLLKSLDQVLTDASSEAGFNAPANRARVDHDVQAFAGLAHDLNLSQLPKPDADPNVALMGMLFQEETHHAYQELQRGNRTYARNLLRGVTTYCIACHTRNDSGPSFASLKPASERLSALEQGEFYASTRQYDQALAKFHDVLRSENSSGVFEKERAVRYSLAILVRVKKDPKASLALVNEMIASRNGPYFFRENLEKWKVSLEAWRDEAPRTVTTEDGLFAEGTRLIAAARQTQQAPLDESADILFLRGSAVLHEQLTLAPRGPHAAEALLLEGVAYEALRDLRIWGFHELQYEACIYEAPHTPISRSCFGRYQESVYAGYTGSAGTDLPDDVRSRLNKLEQLALPEHPAAAAAAAARPK